MKRSLMVIALLATTLAAEEKSVRGTISYVASGVVYTTLGRDAGVKDSLLIYAVSGTDTFAVLRTVAVSSKSSACRIEFSKRPIATGNAVVARVTVDIAKGETLAAVKAPAVSRQSGTPGIERSMTSTVDTFSPFEIHGRMSAQYFGNRYDNAEFNTTQPGVVLNLRGRTVDLPLKFEVYANLRTLSYGSASPLSKGSVNQSRIYRLSMEYDDGVNTISIGRLIPAMSPSVGYTDGLLVSRKFGSVTIGATAGYMPSFTLRGVSSEYRKVAFFTSVQLMEKVNFSITGSYGRTYFHSTLDREVTSGQVSLYTSDGFSVYGYSEFDLRRKAGSDFALNPLLTSLFINANYRMTEYLTVGIGADASRPLYTLSASRLIPDSLLERRLRSGLNTTITMYLANGVMLSNTYTPRTSEARFARVYTNNTSLALTNIIGSGVSIRSNFNLNANEYSDSKGYGVNVQRNIADLVDINARYQQYNYTLKNYNDRHQSQTVGGDIIVMLTRRWAVMFSYDRLKGYGTTSHSLFADLSVRF